MGYYDRQEEAFLNSLHEVDTGPDPQDLYEEMLKKEEEENKKATTILGLVERINEAHEEDVKPRSKPVTHDFTAKNRKFGHDFRVLSVNHLLKKMDVYGWANGLRIGDYLLFDGKTGVVRFKIVRLSYTGNPPNRWEGQVVFAPKENTYR